MEQLLQQIEEYKKENHDRIVASLQGAVDKRLSEVQSEILKS